MIVWAQESTRDKALAVPGITWVIVMPDALVESAGGFEQAIATGAFGSITLDANGNAVTVENLPLEVTEDVASCVRAAAARIRARIRSGRAEFGEDIELDVAIMLRQVQAVDAAYEDGLIGDDVWSVNATPSMVRSAALEVKSMRFEHETRKGRSRGGIITAERRQEAEPDEIAEVKALITKIVDENKSRYRRATSRWSNGTYGLVERIALARNPRVGAYPQVASWVREALTEAAGKPKRRNGKPRER